MSKLTDHRVRSDGWVLGVYRKAGDIVPMTEAQAKYEPNVERAENAPAPTARKASRRKSDEESADT